MSRIKRSVPLISRISLILLFVYAQVVGATTTGILLPETRLLTLIVLSLLIAGWLLAHRGLGWRWHRTLLDEAWLLWGLVLLIALLANPQSARLILLSMWYAGVYVGLWYFFQDLLANRALSANNLIDIFLLGGSLTVIFAFIQIVVQLSASGGRDPGFMTTFNLRGLLINANAMATFLLVTLLLLWGRLARTGNALRRFILAAYLLLLLGLFILTNSRGALLSLMVGLAVWFVLLLMRKQLLSFAGLTQWWRSQPQQARIASGGGFVLLIGLSAGAVLWVLFTVLNSRSGLSLRPQLLQAAATLFSEKPLTGHGLSTFGQHLFRFISIPPLPPLKNAHNFPANVMAELGLPGLVAMLIIFGLIVVAAYRSWRSANPDVQIALGAAVPAAAAYAFHHLLDVTSATPIIALVGLLLLIVITAPIQPLRLARSWARAGRWSVVAGLWALLLACGFWDGSLYARYMQILNRGIDEGHYAEAATQLQEVADADPSLSVYPAQQAYFWGLAAAEGDAAALQEAIARYEKVIQMEPEYAPYLANLGALYMAADQAEQALDVLERAAALAPESWALQFHAGAAADALGRDELAWQYYRAATTLEDNLAYYPEWDQSPLRQALPASDVNYSRHGMLLRLIENGQYDLAENLLFRFSLNAADYRDYILGELLALARDDINAALYYLDRARAQGTASDRMWPVWVLIGEARLARYQGDDAQADKLLDDARAANIQDRAPFLGSDFAFYQYFRQTVYDQFLPQVFYPKLSPLIGHLLTGI